MRDRYVILGYGSLIWDLERLAPHVRLPWFIAGGPALPMEFSRISPKRKMGLVVVIDPRHGVPCPTHAVVSRRDDIHAAAEDLRLRERAPHIGHIGAVCRVSGLRRSQHAEVAEQVAHWCEAAGARGAVWTDLPANFAEHTGQTFSLAAALDYLRGLPGESLHEALRYIDNAPPLTDTPLRRYLAGHPWWRGLPREAQDGAPGA